VTASTSSVRDAGHAEAEGSLEKEHRDRTGLISCLAVASTVLALSACGHDSKKFDIAPIFPLSSDKCAKYGGKPEGSGLSAHCWVTKAKCEQAAADWMHAMQQGGVTDAIQFRCD
jgi:hypothetical protein